MTLRAQRVPSSRRAHEDANRDRVDRISRRWSSSARIGRADDAESEDVQRAEPVGREAATVSRFAALAASSARSARRGRPAAMGSLRLRRQAAARAAVTRARPCDRAARKLALHEHEDAPAEDRPRGPEVAHARERPRSPPAARAVEAEHATAPARLRRGAAHRRAAPGRSATSASSSPRVARRSARPSALLELLRGEPPLAAGLSRDARPTASRSASDASARAHRRYCPWKPNGMWCGASARASSPNEPASSTSRKERPRAGVEHDREDHARRPRPRSPGARTKTGSPG